MVEDHKWSFSRIIVGRPSGRHILRPFDFHARSRGPRRLQLSDNISREWREIRSVGVLFATGIIDA